MPLNFSTHPFILHLVFFLVALPGQIVVAEILAGDRSPKAESGRVLYMLKGCYLCHGLEGQGAILTGSRLAPEPMPIAQFNMAIRKPRNVMPAYSPSVLSDIELESIHYFLTTIPQVKHILDKRGRRH